MTAGVTASATPGNADWPTPACMTSVAAAPTVGAWGVGDCGGAEVEEMWLTSTRKLCAIQLTGAPRSARSLDLYMKTDEDVFSIVS